MIIRYTLIFSAILLFLSNSTGFDFYGHVAMYYFFEEAKGAAYSFADLIILPRYFLLSYIYETFSRIGIPLGYIVIILLSYALNEILKSMDISNKLNIYHIFILLVVFYSFFYYSALSLSLVYCIAYMQSKKKFFLIGAFFHPLSFVLFLLVSLFIKGINFRPFVFAICIFIVFVFLENFIVEFYIVTNRIESVVVFESIFENSRTLTIYLEKILSKVSEIKTISILIILYFIYNKLNIKMFIDYKYVAFSLVLISLFLTSVMIYKEKPTLPYYILVEKNINNHAIKAAWFDFGKKEIKATYGEMYLSRYEKYKGIVH